MGRSTGGGGGSKRGGMSAPKQDTTRAQPKNDQQDDVRSSTGQKAPPSPTASPTDSPQTASASRPVEVQVMEPQRMTTPPMGIKQGVTIKESSEKGGPTPWQHAVKNALVRTAPAPMLGTASSIDQFGHVHVRRQSSYNSPTQTVQHRASVHSQARPHLMNRSIEDLLVEQLVAIEQALAFNSVISEKLANERLIANQASRTEAGSVPISISHSDKRKRVSMKRQSVEIDKLRKEAGVDDDNNPLEPLLEGQGLADLVTDGCDDGQKSASVTHLFPTLGGVKQLVVECLSKPSYRVEDYYKTTGFWQWLAQHPWFNNATLVVIVLNTLWIAIDTDLNKADTLAEALWPFQLMDNVFCTYFSFEMLTRFSAFRRKCDAFTDAWFIFDGFLVALMVWETWINTLLSLVLGDTPDDGGGRAGSILRIFRVFRLTRVARTARLLSSVPELMILAKGMFVAMRSVMAILCLLALVIYIFSIVFTQLLADSTVNAATGNHFNTVPNSANFLLLQVLCGFDADFIDKLWTENMVCYVLFLLYLLVGSLTIMNMLIGILCDVVSTVAEEEKDATFEAEMERKVESLAQSLDRQNLGTIAKADFEDVIKQPEVILDLTDLGVDVVGLMDFAYFVFQDVDQLSYTNFLHMVIQFRGSKMATVKDIMDMRKQMSMQLSKILEAYESEQQVVNMLQERIEKVIMAHLPQQ